MKNNRPKPAEEFTPEELYRKFNSKFIQYELPIRFLYGSENKHKRLFWIKYEAGELYFGSSLTSITSSGKSDVQDVQISRDKSFRIVVDNSLPQGKYQSLKFSFHSSGVRHLKIRNSQLNKEEELYREKYKKLEDLAEPEMLFIIITKRISMYEGYQNGLTRGRTTACSFNTPQELMKYRQVFEFYISKAPEEEVPPYIIKPGDSHERLTIRLREGLFLHVKFVVNAAENILNSMYPEREILLFQSGSVLKSYSFK